MRTVTLPTPGSSKGRETIDFVVVDDLATLVWTANLASLELHTHMWRVDRDAPDLVVFDLDPGPPATVVECCRVACLLRPLLEADGLVPYAKTSGSKGLQLYARAEGLASSEQTSAYAKGLAQRLEQRAPRPRRAPHDQGAARRQGARRLVAEQRGQDHRVGLQPARPRAADRVDPGTWDEVEACADPADLVFTSDDVLARVERSGDLFAPLLGAARVTAAPAGGGLVPARGRVQAA